MSEALRCDQLQVRYRGKSGQWTLAVDHLNLKVEEGEIVGFLGPNGAGKSSTLKALMGFVAPAGGSATLFGHPAGSIEARKLTGYLPEVAMYYPFLTPLETLTLYGELQGIAPRRLRSMALELLELVGIASSAHRQNRTLSKGMLQRVGIAQALLGEPRLLILDEVTSGLDPIGRRELRTLLKERHRQGATLFFSSHELSEVSLICDRILLIDKGRLIEERRLAELQQSLQQFVLVFEGAVGMVDLTQALEPLGEGAFQARFDSKPALIEAMERVHASGGRVHDVVAQEGSLEDYFIESIASHGRAA